MTDSNGFLVGSETYQYDPYGQLLHQPRNPVLQTNTWRYSGGYFDTGTGLYKFGIRYYDAALGRWTQRDPVGGSLQETTKEEMMNTLLIYLLIEDGLSLVLIIILLYLKQRPYIILAIIIFILMILSNILYFKVLPNAFIGGFPLLIFAFVGPSLGRFNTHLRINNVKILKVLLIVLLTILLLCVLGLFISTFVFHTK